MSRWNTVAIYGVGLIGGSIGMALRQRDLADKVIGIGRNAGRLASAVKLEAIDEFVTDVAEASPPDITVLCAPVQRLPEHCAAVYKCFPKSLITDAGSTKQLMIEQIQTASPNADFIGSHPLAGSDKSGVEHAQGDLFVDRTVIVTPTKKTSVDTVAAVTDFWKALGAETVSMDPAEHDRALAITSHVPHVLASLLASETPENVLHLVAGGWRDTTRIAAADVELWTQILQENSANVLTSLRSFQSRLQEFESALNDNNKDTISRLLTAGKQRRDALGS